MNTSPGLIFAYIIGMLVLYLLCRVFIKPLKWFLRLILSCALGCLAMTAVNFVFSRYGVIFEINLLTAMMSGVLGIPGMDLTFILSGIL